MGTETSPDRSKSIKSHLMPVFTAAGNHSVQVCNSSLHCLTHEQDRVTLQQQQQQQRL